jgi:hypothetical protein
MSQYTREELVRKVENRESLERVDLRGIDLEEVNLEGEVREVVPENRTAC